MSSSGTTPVFGPFVSAIVNALQKNPQGLRYCKLYRISGEEYRVLKFKVKKQTEGRTETQGKNGINIKTFNKHLKRLVKEGIVERIEENRYKVLYKLQIPEHSFPKEYIAEVQKCFVPAFRSFMNKVDRSLEKQKGSDLNDRSIVSQEEDVEFLVESALTWATGGARASLVEAVKLYQENPTWARYLVDKSAELTRQLCNEVAQILGDGEEIRMRVIPVLDKLERKRSRKVQTMLRPFDQSIEYEKLEPYIDRSISQNELELLDYLRDLKAKGYFDRLPKPSF